MSTPSRIYLKAYFTSKYLLFFALKMAKIVVLNSTTQQIKSDITHV